MRKLSPKAVLEMYLNALAHVYDPHSDYMGRSNSRVSDRHEPVARRHRRDAAGRRWFLQNPRTRPRRPGGAQRPAQEWRPHRGRGADRQRRVHRPHGLPLPQAVELIRGEKGTPVRLSIIPASAPTLPRARRSPSCATRSNSKTSRRRRASSICPSEAARRSASASSICRASMRAREGKGAHLRHRRCRQAGAQVEAGKRDRASSSTCAAMAVARSRRRSVLPASSFPPARSADAQIRKAAGSRRRRRRHGRSTMDRWSC